jgi:primosomal protein N' (replication factor Y)
MIGLAVITIILSVAMEYFYYVWVRSQRYHGTDALTYASDSRIATGSVVQVALQTQTVLGLVTGPASRPRFKTKPIQRIYDVPTLPHHLIKLAQWLAVYYPAPLGSITQQLLPASLSDKQLAAVKPDESTPPSTTQLPPLSAEQQAALTAMEQSNTYLLHGATGSGKTRLYIELSLKALTKGTSAIILTPEISLTSQLADNFRDVFGARVIVLHSKQAPSERQQAWLSISRATQPTVVIGPRSALFSPLPKLGLIVLDESHESAYKQEQAPQYQTGRVASYVARLTRATLVLGSATPAIADYYLAEQKHKPIIELRQLAHTTNVAANEITVVDMKQRELFSRSPYMSRPLLDAITTALGKGEQSLLYLNRRGTARLVMCEKCGWQADCPHCDIPLTYHSDTFQLRCHSCNYHTNVPSNCPVCGHTSILFKTVGTKAVVEEVNRLFPQAKIARFDTDNTKNERFEQHYAAVRRGEVDILIGTQLLAKGLDLPKLSTLGIILADTSLYLPDFSATERTFQLLTQVLGRIGRGHVAGHAIIQTYHPDHPLLRRALDQDYSAFYTAELKERKQFMFPPFCHMLKLSCRRATQTGTETAALKLKAKIEANLPQVHVEGPAPAFHERFQGKFQWQLVIKALQRSDLLAILSDLPANWSADIDPVDLL